MRSRTTNWYGQLQYDDKSLKDAIGSTATLARNDLHNVVLGLNGEWQDGWFGGGGNALALNLVRGRAQLDASSFLQDAASARSAGSFTKLGYQLQRLQVLAPGLGLALSATGQFANRNLVSAEKFSLGGSQGVRAFAQGEANGDEGWLASAELRWQPMPGWQFKAFYDAGGVKINRRPWTDADNQRRLAGAGLGMGWASGKTAFTLTAAWPTRRDAAVLSARSQHGGRFWGQMTVAF
ncbi:MULTISPECIES: ShlB/FhaC/HecB family hemolysin secretion/activation protein [unclassified Variovorax]|uniref:ShlB/FhaC/HecB family hemolysin secretion/activation protein n=1 Tax=unclassified Variovorax TaxID=663243 RepID=UPI003F44AB10